MLTEIDHILYPDRCEVLKIENDYFYPIFKNGSSSLKNYAKNKKSKIMINHQILECDSIKVFLRNPYDRLISGSHTFIENLLITNPDLDEKTIIWFMQNYLFLDRHFLPQFLWLINLTRYCNPTCKLSFFSLNDLPLFIDVHINKTEKINPIAKKILDSKNINSYLELEEELVELVGRTLVWDEVYKILKLKNKNLYDHIFEKVKTIANALP